MSITGATKHIENCLLTSQIVIINGIQANYQQRTVNRSTRTKMSSIFFQTIIFKAKKLSEAYKLMNKKQLSTNRAYVFSFNHSPEEI